MRILFLTQTYPRFEGDTAGPFIRDLAAGLVRGGDEVAVLAPHAEGVRSEWQECGVEVETFRYAPESWERIGYSRSLDADETVKPGAGLVAPLYLWHGRRALRAMLERQRTDLLHAHWIVPNGIVAAPLGSRVSLAIGLHGSDVFLAEKPILRGFVGRCLDRACLLTGCSPELVDRVRRLGSSTLESRVIPYGVDTRVFSPAGATDHGEWRRKLGIPASAVVILSVGRMVTKKGYQILLPVFESLLGLHPDAHLVLAGEGDRRVEFEALSERWRDRIHFPGIVYRQDLPDLYRTADLFVLPAIHDPAGNVDGLPNVILEAMASGLPVVASEISGIPLAVEDESTGLLVPEGDGAALLEALDRLLKSSETRLEMGTAGRRKAEEELTWDAVAGLYRKAYEDVLGEVAGSSE